MNLTTEELLLLRWVRQADEEVGGLWEGELEEGQRDALFTLCDCGVVERLPSAGGFEEHGDEDVDDGGVYRVTEKGVNVLRECEALF